ncbi:MAG: UDP-N-acetylglucosamine 2-epimerase, partial [Oscillospiraceae bacterium]
TVFFVLFFPHYGATISTVVLTLVVLVFGEVSPKSLAKERPEAVAAGTAVVAGTHREKIVEICERLLTDTDFYEGMSKAKNPYGDGSASRRIADILSGECF